MLVRREVIEEIGSLSTEYFHFCEDVDLCLEAQRAGWELAVAPEARLTHKVSATTRVSSPTFLYYNLRSRLNLVRNFGPAGAPGAFALAVLWLRLWRPALLSGQGLSGWRALRRAHRDFLARETGPAPADLGS
jgi:GT2 family glycosyltransferase